MVLPNFAVQMYKYCNLFFPDHYYFKRTENQNWEMRVEC